MKGDLPDPLPPHDFRNAAIDATKRTGVLSPPIWGKSGGSGVWQAEPGGRRLMRRMAVLGWSCLALAGVAALLGISVGKDADPESKQGFRDPKFIVLMASSVVMFGSLLVGLFLPKAITRRAALERGQMFLRGNERGIVVSIEDGMTFHKPKVSPEDWGLLLLDPTNNRLRIIGLICVYDVDAKDAVSVDTASGIASTVPIIHFQVGDVRVAITTSNQSLVDGFKQHFGIRRPGLLKPIRETLGVGA